MDTQGLRKRSAQAAENIRRTAEEIRLELHLANMELKDAWKKLEPRIDSVEKLAEDALEDLDKRVTEFRQRLKSARH